MSIQSIQVRKKGEKPPIEPIVFEKVFEYTALENGNAFRELMAEQLGLFDGRKSLRSNRFLTIDPVTCKPAVNYSENNMDILIDSTVVMYTMLEAKNYKLRVAMIGTTKRTAFVISRPEGAYFFLFDQSSINAKEAVINLYVNNLNKGCARFTKTLAAGPGFMQALFECVNDDLTVYPFTIRHSTGTAVSSRLYLDPDNSSNNMLSVSGMVYDVDLNEYPTHQIRRGYQSRPKEV